MAVRAEVVTATNPAVTAVVVTEVVKTGVAHHSGEAKDTVATKADTEPMEITNMVAEPLIIICQEIAQIAFLFLDYLQMLRKKKFHPFSAEPELF